MVRQRGGDKAVQCSALHHLGQNKQEQQKSAEMSPDTPSWVIRGGSSSRSRGPPDWIIRGQRKSTPTLQALAEVRVVASLLGRSRKNKLCSHAQTQVDHLCRPTCITKGADQTHSITAAPGMAGTEERKTLSHKWRGTSNQNAFCQGW